MNAPTADSMRPKKVLLAIRTAGVPGRRKLAGVFRYLEEHQEHWDIRFVRTQEYFTDRFVRSTISSGVDGVIASFPDAREANIALESSSVPTVILDPRDTGLFPKKRKSIVWIQSDAVAIGREAAAHLTAQGRFASYGYVHDRAYSSWSEARAAAFSDAVGTCEVFRAVNLSPDRDMAELARWMRALPKPSGVMVAYDDRAIVAMEACRHAALDIPRDVAIVSCDNDELICNHLSPGLTSIEADFTGIGYRAAEALSRMMRGTDGKPAALETFGAVRLVARGSSAPVSSGSALVLRAMKFIDENASSGICAQNVVDYLRVSRRLADLRFREVRGTSISDAIRDRRISEVKDRLMRTDDKIEAVAASCGFPDPKHLMTLFRKTVGCSMSEWRVKSRKEVCD